MLTQAGSRGAPLCLQAGVEEVEVALPVARWALVLRIVIHMQQAAARRSHGAGLRRRRRHRAPLQKRSVRRTAVQVGIGVGILRLDECACFRTVRILQPPAHDDRSPQIRRAQPYRAGDPAAIHREPAPTVGWRRVALLPHQRYARVVYTEAVRGGELGGDGWRRESERARASERDDSCAMRTDTGRALRRAARQRYLQRPERAERTAADRSRSMTWCEWQAAR